MQKEYDSIKELEELISTKYQRLVEETIDIEKKENIRKKAIEMTKKHFDIYTISPDELLEILKIIDGNMAPSREEIFSKQNTYKNQTISNSKNMRYQKAKEFLNSKRHLIELFALAKSEAFTIKENRAELDRFSNILSKIKEGKIIDPEMSIDEIMPIIEQYFPQDEQMGLLIDITKSISELQSDILNQVQKEQAEKIEVKEEPVHEQIESLETNTPEEIKIDSLEQEEKEEEIEEQPVEEEVIEEKQENQGIIQFDEETYEQIKEKVFEEEPTFNNKTTNRIITHYVGPFLSGNIPLEEIKEILPYKEYFKQFASEVIKKHIENIDECRKENPEKAEDKETLQSIINETYTKMIELYNEGFTEEEKEIGIEQEETNNKMPVIFTGSGKRFKKSIKNLASDKKSREEIETTIENLRYGYTQGKPLLSNKDTGGLQVKGRNFKVIYKEFDGHIILHDVVKKADLNGYINVSEEEVKDLESKIKSNGKESMELESDGETLFDEIMTDLGKDKINE